VSGEIDWDALRRAADEARAAAYAPYSGFSVGAALLADDGRIFSGTNVENASYGLTVCAERHAIGAAVRAGARHFQAIAITAPGPRPTPPCGACRQVLAEFPPSFEVRSYAPDGTELRSDVAALLPSSFDPSWLRDRG
jgi:cytidine deaminase